MLEHLPSYLGKRRLKEQRERDLNPRCFSGVIGLSGCMGSTLGAVAGADPSHPPLCFSSSWKEHPSTNTRHPALSSASRYNLSGQCHISHGLVAVPCSCSGTHIPIVSPQPLPYPLSPAAPVVGRKKSTAGFLLTLAPPVCFLRISKAMLKWACWILAEEEDS